VYRLADDASPIDVIDAVVGPSDPPTRPLAEHSRALSLDSGLLAVTTSATQHSHAPDRSTGRDSLSFERPEVCRDLVRTLE
jgi:hypothetical protein